LGQGIPREVVERSIHNSLCFGLYAPAGQVGFGRVITDYATFAYIEDVFVTTDHRGLGLATWLVLTILQHPSLKGLRSWWLLASSSEARRLFEKAGFRTPHMERLERWMALPGGSRGFYTRATDARTRN
jgi:GNAT superfamily N-acetyltransferase